VAKNVQWNSRPSLGSAGIVSWIRRTAAGFRARLFYGSLSGIHGPHPEAVTLGTHTYIGDRTLIRTFWPSERIRIGSWCSIADEVRILHFGVNETFQDREGQPHQVRIRGWHRGACATTFPIGVVMPHVAFDVVPADGSLQSRPLVIGSDVWIGYGSMVIGALTVGHGAIVGAGSVVVSDVPPYAVVVGNPARVIRRRFSPIAIAAMLRIAWWDWPAEKVVENGEWFIRPINEFIEHFDPNRSG
jgi:acetyltransferase-like isoleucine patch superfamily enzyme